MKKIIEISAMGLAIAALAASCAKEMNTVTPNGPTEKLSITATLGEEQDAGKTVLYDKPTDVRFTSSDRLFVFGDNAGPIEGKMFSPNKETLNGRTISKVFECESWPAGVAPIYAVSTTISTGNACTADGHITLNVNNAIQKLDWSKSYASNTCTHVGKVEGSEVKQLKNVCALIGFTLSDQKDDIVSISVTHDETDAVHFGGLVTVDCSATDPVPTVESYVTPTDEILVTVADKFDNKTSESDNIPVNTQFYLSVLPGEYHNVKFTLVDSQGWVATRTFSRIKVARSTVSDLPTALNCDKDGNVLTFIDPTEIPMPDVLTFKLGKEWNFIEKPKAAADQAEGGDTYAYKYIDSVTGYQGQFTFVFGGGYIQYSDEFQSVDHSAPDESRTYIDLPAIPGRILASVSITHRMSGSRSASILKSDSSTLKEMSIPANSTGVMDVVLLTEENTSYKLCFGPTKIYCPDITVTYITPAPPVPMPETLTFDLVGNITKNNSTYHYIDSETGYTHDFEFPITGECTTSSTVIKLTDAWSGNKSYITIPAIEGRVLSKIVASIGNTSDKNFGIRDLDGNLIAKVTCPKTATQNTPGPEVEYQFFANGDTKTASNTQYYFTAENSSLNMTRIKLVYETALPLPETIELDCTDASKFRYNNGESVVGLEARNSNVECDFWLAGLESYVFHGTVAQWNKTLNAASNSIVKLPLIPHYKLSEVYIAGVNNSGNKTYNVTDGTNTLGTATVNKEEGASNPATATISLTDDYSSEKDYYLVCTSEMAVKFKLTYTLQK